LAKLVVLPRKPGPEDNDVGPEFGRDEEIVGTGFEMEETRGDVGGGGAITVGIVVGTAAEI
jgi:hypothetical protein